MAGVEAAGAGAFEKLDPQLSWKCGRAAQEDFFFAQKVFEKEGILRPCWGEHTYHESLSQHYAAAVWAGTKLYALNGEGKIRERVLEDLDKLLDCQDHGETGTGLSGFF